MTLPHSHSLQSPGSTRGSGPLRVCQLREEEGMDVVNREAAHEKTVKSTLQITDCLSQSWEDITLVCTAPLAPYFLTASVFCYFSSLVNFYCLWLPRRRQVNLKVGQFHCSLARDQTSELKHTRTSVLLLSVCWMAMVRLSSDYNFI